MNFVQQYSQWYCHRCQQYQQPPAHAQAPAAAAQPQYRPQPAAQPPHPQQYQQAAPPAHQYQQPPQGYGHQQPPAQQQQYGYAAGNQAHQQAAAPTHGQYAAQPAYPQGNTPQPPTGPQPQYGQQPTYSGQPQQYAQAPHTQYAQEFPIQAKLENEISHAPSFSAIVFHLKQGQRVTAEAGAMMYMHSTVDIDTHGRKGGILKGLGTALLGGESFFVNTFTAVRGPGDLALVGPVMGDIRPVDLAQGMILQSGAFLASDPTVNLDTKWQGLKGFLTDRDFVMLHATGPGTVWVSSFGGIIEKTLAPGEVLSVDTGHIVAFPDTMQFSVRRVGGWKSTILSGEGLVTDFVGPGKILMQTRHLPAFVEQLLPYLPQNR
jgi:uncharacterized protein (TIGR00266 family)